MNSDERRLNTDERRVSSDERRVNTDERRMNSDERRVSSYERWLNIDERRVSTHQRRVNSDERLVCSDERRPNTDERRMHSDERREEADGSGSNSDGREFKFEPPIPAIPDATQLFLREGATELLLSVNVSPGNFLAIYTFNGVNVVDELDRLELRSSAGQTLAHGVRDNALAEPV